MADECFKSVWDALYPDDAGKRATMEMSSNIMSSLSRMFDTHHMDDTAAAALIGGTPDQARLIRTGKINSFTLDTLVAFAAYAGLDPEMHLSAA